MIRAAPHVVNVTGNNKWMVWAPTGRPYPPRGRKTSFLLNKKDELQSTDMITIADGNKENVLSRDDDSGVSVSERAMIPEAVTNIVEDTQPLSGSQLKSHPVFTQFATTEALQETGHTSTVQDKPDVVEPLETSSTDDANTAAANNENTSKMVVDDDDTSLGHIMESSVDPPTSTSPSLHKCDNEITAETYGFLEKTLEPDLMAELRASGEQHQKREQTLSELLNTRPLPEQAIQLLMHFAKPLSEIDLEADDGENADEPEEQAEPEQPSGLIDYLKTGMTPDQVLEEMRALKERSGGYLSPEKMDPFLTYFGELSSRELDRLESLEEQEKPKPKKGAAKKKRVMAIRFPDKSPAPSLPNDDDPYKEQQLYSAELLRGKLPAAPDFENMSDSSDSDGSCPRPLEREEYIKTLLERGIPSFTEEDVERATQAVDKEANRKTSQLAAATTKVDWPSLETGSGGGIVSDIPKPLLSISEVGQASACKLFDDPMLALDPTTKSDVTEWPDLL